MPYDTKCEIWRSDGGGEAVAPLRLGEIQKAFQWKRLHDKDSFPKKHVTKEWENKCGKIGGRGGGGAIYEKGRCDGGN